MFLIENKEKLSDFISLYKNENSMIIPYYLNDEFHPKFTSLSFLCIYLMKSKNNYIIPINHQDVLLNVNLDFLNESTHFKFIKNKKKFLYFYKLNNSIDIDLINYIVNGNIDKEENIPTSNIFLHSLYHANESLNSIIPISKHIEKIENGFSSILDLVNLFSDKKILENIESFNFLNGFLLEHLWKIEKNGLKINLIEFDKHFNYNHFENDYVYSEYHIYTSTGRPSNRFGGLNFSALNKKDDSRKSFISRYKHGLLVEFDWDAYHLVLIAKLVGYPIPNISMHEYLGRKYFNVDVLTEEQYDQSKQKSFFYLYGGIKKEVENIEFFRKTKLFINELWKQWNLYGYITTPISNKKIYKELHEISNKQILFNYLIQAYEMSNSIQIISEINNYFDNVNDCKPILYTYDSILFDVEINDNFKKNIGKIKEILEQNEFHIKYKYGKNYGEMS